MKILLVEDEEKLAQHLLRGLREEGHQVDWCANGRDARGQATDIDYDVVVLDWTLPDIDGLAVLRTWRREGMRTPVIMLTARGTVGERVSGLRTGADDYMVKPFDFEELVARLEALHRRSVGALDTYQTGAVRLDGKRRSIESGGAEIELTAREFALARELFSRSGEVLSRSSLLSAVWGSGFGGDPNILDVYVGYLRNKLAALGDTGVELRTVRGVGFRLVAR